MATTTTTTTTPCIPKSGEFTRPTVSIEDDESHDVEEGDDVSEQSPEPSPLAPPQPLQEPLQEPLQDEASTALSDPLGERYGADPSTSRPRRSTPRSTTGTKPHGSKKKNDHEDEISLPSLPEAPSPHSPPPPSLFSEAEETERRRRRSNTQGQRPMKEIHLRSSDALASVRSRQSRQVETNAAAGDDISSTASADDPTAVRQRSLSSQSSAAATRPTNLLPALLQLKQDLIHSQQKVFLLEEENKARNQQFEIERIQWQEAQKQQASLLEQERTELEEQLKTEHSSALRELESRLEQLDKQREDADNCLAMTQKELDQKQTAWDQQQQEYQSLQMQIEEAQLCLTQEQEECQSLRNQQDEMIRRKEQEMAVTMTSLQAEVEYWKNELSASHEEYRQKLSQTAQLSSTHQQQLEEYTAALEKAHATISDLRAEKLALRQELVQTSIRRTSVANAACQTDEDVVEDEASSDADATVDPELQLHAENTGQQHTSQPVRRGSHISSFSTITEEMDKCEAEGLGEPLSDGRRLHSLGETPLIPTESRVPADESQEQTAVPIRYSEAFQRNLDAMREKHDQEVRQLVRSYQELEEEEIVQPVVAAEERQAQDKAEQEQVDENDYELRLQQMVEQHHLELTEMKARFIQEATKEAVRVVLSTLHARSINGTPPGHVSHMEHENNRNESGVGDQHQMNEISQTVAEESLRAVVGATNTLDNDITRREDNTLDEARSAMNGPNANSEIKATSSDNVLPGETARHDSQTKSTLQHRELLKLQSEWQDQTNELLDAIQKECNDVFERNRTQRARTSPRTVAIADLSVFADDNDDAPHDNDPSLPPPEVRNRPLRGGDETISSPSSESAGQSNCSPSQLRSSLSPPSVGMELDRTLDETEALLRSLMGTI